MRLQFKILLITAAAICISSPGYSGTHDTGHNHSDAQAEHAAHTPGEAIQHTQTPHDHASNDHANHGKVEPDPGHHIHDLSAHDHAGQSHVAQPNVLGISEPAGSTDKYTCPMHPNIITHEPGSCPICGMHLVKMVQNEATQPAQTDQSHEHHDHADHGSPEQISSPLGHGLSTHNHASQSHAAQPNVLGIATSADSTDKYTCPMHPSIITHEPGNCPICGMNLVKVVHSESGKGSDLVHVDAATQQRMGVQLQTAKVTRMYRAIDTFATITSDQSRSVSVNSFVTGWIKRWHVQGIGQSIKKGQILYEIYSPELQQRQREYLNILTRLDSMRSTGGGMTMSRGQDLSAASFVMLRGLAKDRFRTRDRLLDAGVPSSAMERLEKNRRILDVVPIHATQDGIVTEMSAREGIYINPQQSLLTYIDNSSVWAEVALYPDQIEWLKNGDAVTLTSGLDDATSVHAQVNLSTLQIDPISRTAKLRLAVSNDDNAFYPGSYAKVTIETNEQQVLSVPRDAVIRTGRGEYVVVNDSPDHFRSAPVSTGIEDKHAVEIRSGLEEGARVVVNGQFLLDAAASLQSMQNRLAATPLPAAHKTETAARPAAIAVADTMPISTHAHP